METSDQVGTHSRAALLLSIYMLTLASQKALGKELIRAVTVGEPARVQELIASGADVETRNPEVSFMLTQRPELL